MGIKCATIEPSRQEIFAYKNMTLKNISLYFLVNKFLQMQAKDHGILSLKWHLKGCCQLNALMEKEVGFTVRLLRITFVKNFDLNR